ncbi:hypothetical protein GCM10025876_41320 [Demequina litorisediminis]|uniref:Helix-turn-helix domain-containing protein n=1 Tax=Demequina litorisediminis TaxID=1849022 RepID=A0ABQ6IJ24_9MICO|nr:hypothetical protein GCM10025876_40110 [Demequina litorisediminis]GMA37928.1 hypothetical protein GCM10025876_41320 [Demequina litorisediminis]
MSAGLDELFRDRAALLPLAEVAEMLCIEKSRVGVWVREGKVPAVRLPGGGQWRIIRDDLKAQARGQRRPQARLDPYTREGASPCGLAPSRRSSLTCDGSWNAAWQRPRR